jgi:hypothetical protein
LEYSEGDSFYHPRMQAHSPRLVVKILAVQSGGSHAARCLLHHHQVRHSAKHSKTYAETDCLMIRRLQCSVEVTLHHIRSNLISRLSL